MNKIIWKNIEMFSYEHLCLEKDKDIVAAGTIITSHNQEPMLIKYMITLSWDWITREVMIDIDHMNRLRLHGDGKGQWFNEKGETISDLSGATDVDISITPFSNSLPINRERWSVGDEKHFEMVYISLPELALRKVEQTYTYLNSLKGIHYFRYECQGYRTEISVDRAGFVINYPNVFERIY